MNTGELAIGEILDRRLLQPLFNRRPRNDGAADLYRAISVKQFDCEVE